jgi:hypothetical protein
VTITYIGLSPVTVGTTGTGSVAPATLTPTLPSSITTDDRIWVHQCHSGVADTTPTDWNALFKDQIIGTGTPAAGTGQRYESLYWRDYDGLWTMPPFSLVSATGLSHAICAVALRADATFDTPTFSSVGSDYGTANTALSATTGAGFTTITGGFLFACVVCNDNVTASSGAISQTGATIGTVTERADSGTASGNDVALKLWTAPVTVGASATVACTATLSLASEGGVIFAQQTESAGTPNPLAVHSRSTAVQRASIY